MMLSEGRVGVDNVYMLKEGMTHSFINLLVVLVTSLGILTLHLEKEKYERAGLVGKPDGVKGSSLTMSQSR
jgi:ribonuclease P/MRP protein subunit RPP40